MFIALNWPVFVFIHYRIFRSFEPSWFGGVAGFFVFFTVAFDRLGLVRYRVQLLPRRVRAQGRG